VTSSPTNSGRTARKAANGREESTGREERRGGGGAGAKEPADSKRAKWEK